MIRTATRTLADWTTAIYPLVLYVYPTDFRREFGDAMAQTFADQTRNVYRTSGLLGLVTLWVRTAFDLVAGVLAAYRPDPDRPLSRATVGAGLLFILTLTAIVGYSAVRFNEFYAAPAFNHLGAPGVREDELIAAYEVALGGAFGDYKSFANGSMMAVTVLLGVAAGLFGLWQKSVLHGVGALLAGAFLTIAALELIPTIWFPFDRYAVGAIWLVGWLPIGAGIGLLVMAFGRFGRGGSELTATAARTSR